MMKKRVETVQDSYLSQSLELLNNLVDRRKTISKEIKELKEEILLYCIEHFKDLDELKVETTDGLIYTLELKPNIKLATGIVK